MNSPPPPQLTVVSEDDFPQNNETGKWKTRKLNQNVRSSSDSQPHQPAQQSTTEFKKLQMENRQNRQDIKRLFELNQSLELQLKDVRENAEKAKEAHLHEVSGLERALTESREKMDGLISVFLAKERMDKSCTERKLNDIYQDVTELREVFEKLCASLDAPAKHVDWKQNTTGPGSNPNESDLIDETKTLLRGMLSTSTDILTSVENLKTSKVVGKKAEKLKKKASLTRRVVCHHQRQVYYFRNLKRPLKLVPNWMQTRRTMYHCWTCGISFPGLSPLIKHRVQVHKMSNFTKLSKLVKGAAVRRRKQVNGTTPGQAKTRNLMEKASLTDEESSTQQQSTINPNAPVPAAAPRQEPLDNGPPNTSSGPSTSFSSQLLGSFGLDDDDNASTSSANCKCYNSSNALLETIYLRSKMSSTTTGSSARGMETLMESIPAPTSEMGPPPVFLPCTFKIDENNTCNKFFRTRQQILMHFAQEHAQLDEYLSDWTLGWNHQGGPSSSRGNRK